MALTSKQIAQILEDIEKNVSVNKLKFSGISVWPLLRLEILSKLRSEPTNDYCNNKNSARFTIGMFLRNLCKTCFLYLFLIVRILRGIIRGDTMRQKDVVFLSMQNERRLKIGGEYFGIFADTLKERLSNFGIKALCIDLYDRQFMYKEPSYGLPFPIEFDPLFYFIKFIHLNRLKYFPIPIKNWGALEKYLLKNIPQLSIKYGEVIKSCNLLLAHKIAFKYFLKFIKPKVSFLVCYYHIRAMAYIWACRELHIKTVDVQHGQQGDYNGMLTHWNKVPIGGYELLPDNFWSWGRKSADRINRYFLKTKIHKAFVGGHPWLARCLQNPVPIKGNQERLFLRKLKLNKMSKILVALQPDKEAINNTLIEALKNSPPDLYWLVRLHPAMSDRKDEINKILKKSMNKNIETNISSSLPLYSLLEYVNFCVTPWSSVAYEALEFGVHPIIIDMNGFEMFKEYINLKLFSKATNGRQLLRILTEARIFPLKNEKEKYIETDFSLIDKALLKLIK